LPKLSDTWTARVWAEFRAGNLTRAGRDVLLTLHTYRAAGGVAWPSHATLAERARCCVSTVQHALKAARELGLITWTERRVRAAWRSLRTTNLYRFLAPAAPVVEDCRPVFRCRRTTGNQHRGVERGENKAAHEGRKRELADMLQAAATLPDLLAMRRAAFGAGKPTCVRFQVV